MFWFFIALEVCLLAAFFSFSFSFGGCVAFGLFDRLDFDDGFFFFLASLFFPLFSSSDEEEEDEEEEDESDEESSVKLKFFYYINSSIHQFLHIIFTHFFNKYFIKFCLLLAICTCTGIFKTWILYSKFLCH